MPTAQELAEFLKIAKKPTFVTGAGISVASGIDPFRGTDNAVWSQTVLEMGTVHMFNQDPVKQWSWYLERFAKARTAKPNPAHYAIAQIERRLPNVRVVTQNIDGLHTAAGSPDVLEVHGKARKVRCSAGSRGKWCTNGAPAGSLDWDDALFVDFLAAPSRDTLPRCPLCQGTLRPHVLWFDEMYLGHTDYRIDEAHETFWDSDLLIFVGTSFSVTVTATAVDAAHSRAEENMPSAMWSIDPISPPPDDKIIWLKERSEDVLPEIVRILDEGFAADTSPWLLEEDGS